MSISQTNVLLNNAKHVKYRISDLNHDTYTVHINASNAEEMFWSGESETVLFFNRKQMQELADKINNFLTPAPKEVEEDCCDSCNISKDECECVDCDLCGEKTKQEDLYQSRCPGCEDQHMVRSIK